jgi:hypothetical protein
MMMYTLLARAPEEECPLLMLKKWSKDEQGKVEKYLMYWGAQRSYWRETMRVEGVGRRIMLSCIDLQLRS